MWRLRDEKENDLIKNISHIDGAADRILSGTRVLKMTSKIQIMLFKIFRFLTIKIFFVMPKS